MYAQMEKKENKSRSLANSVVRRKNVKQGVGFVDNRPEAVAQRHVQVMATNSVLTQSATQITTMPNRNQVIQRLPRNRQDFEDLADLLTQDNALKKDLEAYCGYKKESKNEERLKINSEEAKATLARIKNQFSQQVKPDNVVGAKEWNFIKGRINAAIKDEEMETASFASRWGHRTKKHGLRNLKNIPSITTGIQAGSQYFMGNIVPGAAFTVRSASALLSDNIMQSRLVNLSDIASNDTWTHAIIFKIIPTVGEICKLIEAIPPLITPGESWDKNPLLVIASGIKELRGVVGGLMSAFEGNPKCKAYFNSFMGTIESVLLGFSYKKVPDEKTVAYIINLVAKSIRHLTQFIMECLKSGNQQQQVHPAPQVQGHQNNINFAQQANVQVYPDGVEVHDLEAQ